MAASNLKVNCIFHIASIHVRHSLYVFKNLLITLFKMAKFHYRRSKLYVILYGCFQCYRRIALLALNVWLTTLLFKQHGVLKVTYFALQVADLIHKHKQNKLQIIFESYFFKTTQYIAIIFAMHLNIMYHIVELLVVIAP